MATVATELAKANEKITQLESVSAAQGTALTGLTDDVAYLKEQIAVIGTGELNAEQQAAFDATNARLDSMAAAQQTFTDALKALDETTTRPPTP